MQSILTQALLPTSSTVQQSGAKTRSEEPETELSTDAENQSGTVDEATVTIRQQAKGEAGHSFGTVFETLPSAENPVTEPDSSIAADAEGDAASTRALQESRPPTTAPSEDPDNALSAERSGQAEPQNNMIAAKNKGIVEPPVAAMPVRKKTPVVGAELAFGSRRITPAEQPSQPSETMRKPVPLALTSSTETARPKGEVGVKQSMTPQGSATDKAVLDSTSANETVLNAKRAVPAQTLTEVPNSEAKPSLPPVAQKSPAGGIAQTPARIRLTAVTDQTTPPPKAEAGIVFASSPETVDAKTFTTSQAGIVAPLIKTALNSSTEPRFARREPARAEVQLENKSAKPAAAAPAQIASLTAQNPALQKTSVEASQAAVSTGEGDPVIGPRADISSGPIATAQQHVQATAPLAHHVARQVAEAMQQMPNRPVEITLNPEELGRVRMAMSATETGIVVSVLTERPETADMMRRHISNLEAAFQEIGYSDISFSFDGGTQAESDTEREAGEQLQSEQFSSADDTPSEIASINLSTGPSAGLDIRL